MMKLLSVFILCTSMLFIACDDDNDNGNNNNQDSITQTLSFDSEDIELIFQDGEPSDSLYSSWRRFQIANVLRIKSLSSTHIEVTNFAPVDIDSATIMAAIDGLAVPVELFKISKIKAHARKVIEYPFVGDQTVFLSENGTEVDLSAYKSGIGANQITFDFTGETKLIKKLRELKKVKWEMLMWNFAGGNWATDTSPKDARLFTGLMINYAYMYSSERFKEEYLKEVLIGNDGIAYNNTQKLEVLQKLLDKNYYRCGKVVNVSGLGGGTTLGYAEYILKQYLWKNNVGGIIAHELAHTIGYGHEVNNMTYPKTDENGKKYGFDPVTQRVAKMFIDEGLMPINLDNYYMKSDPQLPTKVAESEILPPCCEDCLE